MAPREPHVRPPGGASASFRAGATVHPAVVEVENTDAQGVMFQTEFLRVMIRAVHAALGLNELRRLAEEEETHLRLVSVPLLAFARPAQLGDELDVHCERLAAGDSGGGGAEGSQWHCAVRPAGLDAVWAEALLCFEACDGLGPAPLPDAVAGAQRGAEPPPPAANRAKADWKPPPEGCEEAEAVEVVQWDHLDWCNGGGMSPLAVINAFERTRTRVLAGGPAELQRSQSAGAAAVNMVIGKMERVDLRGSERVRLGDELVAGVWQEVVSRSVSRVYQRLSRRGSGEQVARVVVTCVAVDAQGQMCEPPPAFVEGAKHTVFLKGCT